MAHKNLSLSCLAAGQAGTFIFINMLNIISTGTFAGLPKRAVVLGAKFVRRSGEKSFKVNYAYNGKNITRLYNEKGGMR
jgi:hypothetical protein